MTNTHIFIPQFPACWRIELIGGSDFLSVIRGSFNPFEDEGELGSGASDDVTPKSTLNVQEEAVAPGETANPFSNQDLGVLREDELAKAMNARKIYGRGKITLFGEGRMGKTSLVRSMKGEKFDPSEKSTSGVDIAFLQFNSVGKLKPWEKPELEFEAKVAQAIAENRKREERKRENVDANLGIDDHEGAIEQFEEGIELLHSTDNPTDNPTSIDPPMISGGNNPPVWTVVNPPPPPAKYVEKKFVVNEEYVAKYYSCGIDMGSDLGASLLDFGGDGDISFVCFFNFVFLPLSIQGKWCSV